MVVAAAVAVTASKNARRIRLSMGFTFYRGEQGLGGWALAGTGASTQAVVTAPVRIRKTARTIRLSMSASRAHKPSTSDDLRLPT